MRDSLRKHKGVRHGRMVVTILQHTHTQRHRHNNNNHIFVLFTGGLNYSAGGEHKKKSGLQNIYPLIRYDDFGKAQRRRCDRD